MMIQSDGIGLRAPYFVTASVRAEATSRHGEKQLRSKRAERAWTRIGKRVGFAQLTIRKAAVVGPRHDAEILGDIVGEIIDGVEIQEERGDIIAVTLVLGEIAGEQKRITINAATNASYGESWLEVAESEIQDR